MDLADKAVAVLAMIPAGAPDFGRAIANVSEREMQYPEVGQSPLALSKNISTRLNRRREEGEGKGGPEAFTADAAKARADAIVEARADARDQEAREGGGQGRRAMPRRCRLHRVGCRRCRRGKRARPSEFKDAGSIADMRGRLAGGRGNQETFSDRLSFGRERGHEE
jgi:hypothetical protein